MLEISGIDPQKVGIHGKEFLKLVREAHGHYEAMMQREEDRPQDPNHQNIIELSSDDEFDDKNGLDNFEGDDESVEERSHFFQPSPDVIALNARSESDTLARETISDQEQFLNLRPLLQREHNPTITLRPVVVKVDVVILEVHGRSTGKLLVAVGRAKLPLVLPRANLQAAGTVEAAADQPNAVGSEAVWVVVELV